jgi:hypothetical protein
MSNNQIAAVWQTMDSAPLDGTRVLLIASIDPLEDKFYTIGYFMEPAGWIADNPSSVGSAIVQPTHWMLLPDMPSE